MKEENKLMSVSKTPFGSSIYKDQIHLIMKDFCSATATSLVAKKRRDSWIYFIYSIKSNACNSYQ